MEGFDLLTLGGVAAKFAWVCAGLIAIGLGLHALLGVTDLQSRATHRSVVAAAAVLAVAVLLRLGFSAVELAGGVDEAPDLLPLVWCVQQPAIISTLTGALALCAGAIWGSKLALAIAVLAAASAFGLTGHAQSQATPSLAAGIVALHVLFAGYWATAPLPLWPKKSPGDDQLAERHRRFGRIALAAVPLLVIAGAVLALWFGGGVAGLMGSPYGAAIASKTLLVAAAVLVGAWNRFVVAKRLIDGPAEGQRALRWAMAADALLFLGAAMAVTLATTIAAPRG